ncbi:MAG: Toprim protein [Thermoplasmatales archaeon I-plasma]|jgi:5S rRNA maturation endonuclease (ribonuclease M5)|nr:MAG: Toprim protein [Thermoplasmatales archaeon I-plasma]MCL5930838.1 toprim domain-containing protein [Candidatus Thermoplasmatota archaeon]
MSAKDNVEKIFKSLEYLKEKNRSIPIVVEGKNDIRALRRLSFEGEILQLHSRVTIEKFCRNISINHKEVILLLDWDSKGKRLTASLIRHLNSYEVKTDLDFWKLCFSMVSQMSNVESLPSVFYRLASGSGASPHT